MSKELVISANRHETRVAMIEDDQVVEIFHQRENEYSLAGSIHKGRVTRVLPGMQSAFVDIGLDRDAFLYVSDFFEDNDEYDKIVTGVEEKVLKLDRTGQPIAPAAEAVPVPVASDGAPASVPADAAPPVQSAPVISPMTPPAPYQGQPEQRRDDRDPRGRRSRRRRGGKGRSGLPDSKYYSPGHRTGMEAPPPVLISEALPRLDAELQPAPVIAAESAAAEDFLVLPGESLAKYTAPVEEAGNIEELEGEEEESAGQAEPPESAKPAAEELPAAVAGEPEPQPVAAEPERIEAETVAEPEEPPAAVFVETEAEPEAETVAMTEAEAAAMELVALEEETGEEPADDEADVEPADEAQPAGEVPAADEGPEPARIPTSLTATLREQGPRYQHRVSRRMRRKGRGDGRDNRGPAPAGVAEAARPPEARQPQEPRSEPRTAPARNIPEPRSDRAVGPSISDLLKEGQEIIVQIAKEPLGQKGARITSHIALPGRFSGLHADRGPYRRLAQDPE